MRVIGRLLRPSSNKVALIDGYFSGAILKRLISTFYKRHVRKNSLCPIKGL